MAFILLVLKARLLKNTFTEYQEAKALSQKAPDSEPEAENNEIVSFGEKLNLKKNLLEKLEKSFLYKYLHRFRRKNSKENICAKSFFGFFGGVLLTYTFFLFFTFGLRFPLRSSTYICALCGIILCLGLAFSTKVRCYVLLMIPVFFSKEGRQVLLTYVLYLSLTGPGKNTMQNLGILSDSMACGQEMIKRTLKQVVEMVRTPFRSIKETLSRLVQTLKNVIKKIKEYLDHVKRIILGILHVIKKAFSWLGSIVNFCNKKLGTPFQRCMKTFEDAIQDCKAKMGIMDFLCYVVHVVKSLCYTVKFLDFICLFTQFVTDSIIEVVKRKLKDFGLQVKTMFYVSIEYSHSYEFHSETSNSTKMVAETIIQKMVEKFEKWEKLWNALGWGFSFFFLFIFYQVYHYKYKYMTSDRYDNHYISKYIVELDMRRVQMNRETVLPLERREKWRYGRPMTFRLLRDERESLLKSLLILTLSTLKIVGFIVCDYCLYWVLFTIYREGHKVYAQVQESRVDLYVTGKGSLAEFYKKLGKSLSVPDNSNLQLDPVHCLPDPVPPDRDRYIQIGYLTALCWFLTITEPYGLRLRNIVMSHFHPDRARERAVWLYNHILRSRGSFLKFARRQLRRKMQGSDAEPIEKVTFMQRLVASFLEILGSWGQVPNNLEQSFISENPILALVLGKRREEACLLCGSRGTSTEPLKKCITPGCRGIYCGSCFLTLNNICTICQHPLEYGDISDLSEERDSSEEDLYLSETRPPTEFTLKQESPTRKEAESDNNETFRDMETRPKFRDLEKNWRIDYAKTTDLDPITGKQKPLKLLTTIEAYEVVKKQAIKILLRLRKQKEEKLKYFKNRPKIPVRASSRLQQQLSTEMLPQEVANKGEQSSNYERILKRAKMLIKRQMRELAGKLKKKTNYEQNFFGSFLKTAEAKKMYYEKLKK